MDIVKYWENCRLITYRKQKEYYRALAEEFLTYAEKCIKDKGCFLAVLGGGKSPAYINEEIIKASNKYVLDWSKIYIILSDERYVKETNDFSNYKLIKETLLDKVDGNSLYPIYKPNSSGETAAGLYHDYIMELWTRTGQDYFDYAMLGVGNDGHTASLFPDRLPANKEDRLAVSGGMGPEGLERISLSIGALNRCSMVSFIVNNVEKIKVLNSMKENWNTVRYPIQNIIRPKNMYILQEE